jgi:signal transduction histidine kinase
MHCGSVPVPSLRAFIASHRDEINAHCVRKLNAEVVGRSGVELAADLGVVLDEIIRALAQDEGLPETSPLPGNSPTAAQHGRRRQQLGYRIETIVHDFGVIADAVGELAARQGLSFEAHQYHVFNRCLDAAIGSALEQYWSEARAQQEHAATERVGLLAHELRNALMSARMAFSVLKTGQMGLSTRTGDVLDRGLLRLDQLIGQALLAVHLEAGVAVAPRRIRAATLLRQLEDSAVLERGIKLVVEVDEELEVEADEQLLTSAVSNLVQNALKFTRAGGRVALRARAEDGDVIIEVEDECGGLPPGKRDELFAPFVQRGHDRRGLGLGLTVTREAIEAQHGKLDVRDLPGRGCVFTVRLGQRIAGAER